MRANAILFWILAVFFLLSAVVYTLWSLLDPMHQKVEWVGTVALLLSAILAAFIAWERDLLPFLNGSMASRSA